MRSSILSAFSLAALPFALAADHLVVVGGPGILQYNPQTVDAAVGDTVTFEFHQKNHTVTQSTFAAPCTQVAGGFDSGFQFVADTNTGGPFQQAQFTVKDTNPVWAFCRQANHCALGMVFAINPGTQYDAFVAAAKATAGGSATTTPAPTTGTTPPTDHKIIVGGTGVLLYSPQNITAAVGDTITFEFHQKNHTATQSSFADPCRKLEFTSQTGQIGFDSGFMPVADDATSFPTFTVTVNDTSPIWAYCRQTAHCGEGMVFAANVVESGANTFEAFVANAKRLNGTTSTGTTSGYGNAAAPTSSVGAASLILAALVGLMALL